MATLGSIPVEAQNPILPTPSVQDSAISIQTDNALWLKVTDDH